MQHCVVWAFDQVVEDEKEKQQRTPTLFGPFQETKNAEADLVQSITHYMDAMWPRSFSFRLVKPLEQEHEKEKKHEQEWTCIVHNQVKNNDSSCKLEMEIRQLFSDSLFIAHLLREQSKPKEERLDFEQLNDSCSVAYYADDQKTVQGLKQVQWTSQTFNFTEDGRVSSVWPSSLFISNK